MHLIRLMEPKIRFQVRRKFRMSNDVKGAEFAVSLCDFTEGNANTRERRKEHKNCKH